MRLVDPIDFQILTELADGKRNTAANLAILLEQDRAYINTRLPILTDYSLLNRVGPASRSGLYEITEKGQLVLDHKEKFGDPDVDFTSLIESKLE